MVPQNSEASDDDEHWKVHSPPLLTLLCEFTAVLRCAVLWCRYTTSQLVEVNAHSLFSKWFSESGKLVSKLFAAITELVEEPQALVFVLIDEVESLSAARKVRTLLLLVCLLLLFLLVLVVVVVVVVVVVGWLRRLGLWQGRAVEADAGR
jgi:hypothetical protein